MAEKNPHRVYTITAHRSSEEFCGTREFGRTITADRNVAVAIIGTFAEQLEAGREEVQAAITDAEQGGEGRLSRNGGFIVVDALCQAISTARPAVAMVLSPGCTDPLIVYGYWQDDGCWADADMGPGAATLLETVGMALEECEPLIGRDSVSVVCQSFTGELTETHTYRPGFPEVGPVDLPTDPANADA